MNCNADRQTPQSAIRNPQFQLDFLIRDARILPLSPGLPETFIGSLGVQGGKIVFIQPGKLPHPSPPADKIIEAGGFLIMPGLVNTHTHSAMTLFRGLADDLPLKTWLEEFIFPAEARFVNPESVYWGTLLACAEMILSGTTTCADGYFCMDGAVRAMDRSGMRAVLCQGVVDFPAPGISDPARNILTANQFVETWKDFSPRIRPGIFCHSPYTCSPETLQAAKTVCRKHQAPFFIHAAETREEVSLVRSRYGKSPVRHLDALEILDDRTVVIHAIHVSAEEIDRLARSGAAVSHCPESNMKLAAGIAPVVEMLSKGIPVGLGTDGCASNNDLDLLKEMDTAAKLEKIRYLDPTVMNDHMILGMATLEGAKVLGLESEIGSLEVGKKADLIFLDLSKPHLIPCYDPFSILVYAAQGSDVQSVMVDGKMIMENHKILAFEVNEVMAEVNRLSREIRSRNK
jgi:5-methylthioadenosine/S-adenosylhomocysteine deaminase